MTAPLLCRYTGDGFELLGRSKKEADAAYVIGQRYTLSVNEERSMATHNHFFAQLHESWSNLPESQAHRFPTETHLRKYALIQTGYRDERVIVCSSDDEALKLAALVPLMDEFAVVTVQSSIVTIARAQTQSMKAMNKKEFQASKEAVLSYVAWMVDVSREELLNASVSFA